MHLFYNVYLRPTEIILCVQEVVVYDDCSGDLATLPSSHTLFLVINSLLEDHRSPVMLVGGLRTFQVGSPTKCDLTVLFKGPRSHIKGQEILFIPYICNGL